MKWHGFNDRLYWERKPTGSDGNYTRSQLAGFATDGRTHSVNFSQTEAFLLNCEEVGETIFEDYDDYDTGLIEAADSVVPYGNYDRWMIFTDLMGWESDAYYEALEGDADRDDPSAIPAFVLNTMAYNCIAEVAKGRRKFP